MVITQGADPVIVVQNGEVTLYDVTKLAADKIVDTNGAGNYYFFQYRCNKSTKTWIQISSQKTPK